MLELWNDEKDFWKTRFYIIFFALPNIPAFHRSIIPQDEQKSLTLLYALCGLKNGLLAKRDSEFDGKSDPPLWLDPGR